MTESITRCPKCKTSFRVSTEHLKTARGAVRCGSCLNIFNAKEHLLKQKATKKTAPEKTKTKTSADAKPAKRDDDDILISDDMLLEEDVTNNTTKIDGDIFDTNVFVAVKASKTEMNLFERRVRNAEDHDKDQVEADESWALNLLEDDHDEASSKAKASEKNTKKAGEQEKTPAKSKKQDKKDTQLDEQSNDEPEETFSSIFQVLEDEDDKYDTGIESFSDALLEESSDDSTSTEKGDPFLSGDSYALEAIDYPESPNTDFLESFETEPLELHVKNQNKFWDTRPFWLSVSTAAFLILVIQAGYFNFDNWGRQDRFRPYYGQFCKLAGCTLPILQDLNKIKIDNMVVIDHPQSQGMLLVDATLQNRAGFDQYFPTLMLTFTDLSNKLVSKMVFAPKDYVGGELAGKNLMPAKHPIHITLEIDDPGVEAVNYQISIVKP